MTKRLTNRTYDEGAVETALCVWEWMLGHQTSHAKPGPKGRKDPFDEMIQQLFNEFGSGAMRSTTIQASIFVDQCWIWAEKRAPQLTTDCFDWEFVPLICYAIDWIKLAQNNQCGNGAWLPDVEEIMAVIVAKSAMKLRA